MVTCAAGHENIATAKFCRFCGTQILKPEVAAEVGQVEQLADVVPPVQVPAPLELPSISLTQRIRKWQLGILLTVVFLAGAIVGFVGPTVVDRATSATVDLTVEIIAQDPTIEVGIKACDKLNMTFADLASALIYVNADQKQVWGNVGSTAVTARGTCTFTASLAVPRNAATYFVSFGRRGVHEYTNAALVANDWKLTYSLLN